MHMFAVCSFPVCSSVLRISLAFVVGVVAASTLTGADKKTAWRPLVDGKTLDGWHPVGDGKWTVEDGAIVGRADKTRLYGLLVSDDVFSDFTVSDFTVSDFTVSDFTFSDFTVSDFTVWFKRPTVERS